MGLILKVYYFYQLTKNKFVKAYSCIFFLFLVAVSTAFTPSYSSQKTDTNAKIKAVFLYNFTKYIEWPAEYQKGEFTIGILGENEALFKELDNMSKVKKVANRSFSIRYINSAEEITNQNILFIPKGSKIGMANALSKIKNKSTLIVTEEPGLAKQGSAINFIVVGNRQKFELNKSNIEKHNLKVASALEKLAVLVN